MANHTRRPPAERFAEKFNVDAVTGCWLWTASKKSNGYGTFGGGGVGGTVYAHRWSYEHHVGLIPEGLQLDHLCRNRACVNPLHLEPVTGRVNVQRGEKAQRTECSKGHPYDEVNTYWKPNGCRDCKTCRKQRRRKNRAS